MFRFFRWYDQLQAPWRFLVLLGLASVGFVLLNGTIFGAIYFIVLISMRIFYWMRYGKHNE